MTQQSTLIKKLEAEINKTPTGDLRNLLCDLNIFIQSDRTDSTKEKLKKAFKHGSSVGTYQMSGMSRKYAPLDFDDWYTENFKESILHAFMTPKEVKSIDFINETEDTFLKTHEKNSVLCEQFKKLAMQQRYLITRDYGFKAYSIQTRGKRTITFEVDPAKDQDWSAFENEYLNKP